MKPHDFFWDEEGLLHMNPGDWILARYWYYDEQDPYANARPKGYSLVINWIKGYKGAKLYWHGMTEAELEKRKAEVLEEAKLWFN